MSKVNGKTKGSNFERKIANLFSSRFEPVTGIKQAFRKNVDSGSYFGGQNQKRVVTHDLDHATFGDIICPTDFKFSVECKHYKTSPTFAAIVKGKITQLDTWLGQARQDAKNSNKKMMLVVKYNGVEEVVFVDELSENVPLILTYKNSYGYLLMDFLKQNNNIFFNNLL
jgi:hypothetical protein